LIGTPSALGKVLGVFGSKEQYSKVCFCPLWEVEAIVNPSKEKDATLVLPKEKKLALSFQTAKQRDEWVGTLLLAKSKSFQFKDQTKLPSSKSSSFSSSSNSSSSSRSSSKSSSKSSSEMKLEESPPSSKSSRCCGCC